MKKMKKIFTMMFVSLVVVTSMTVPQVSAVVQWVTVKEDIVTPGMYAGRHADENGFSDAYFIMNADNPRLINVKVITYFWGDARSGHFTYDNGRNNLGGYTYPGNTQIRSVIRWHFTGHFDGGRFNFMLFSYKLYYMSGSTKIIVGSSLFKYTTEKNYDNDIVHVVDPSSAIPPNVKLFVEVTFKIRAKGGNYIHNFADSPNMISLNSIRYQQYTYTGGGM